MTIQERNAARRAKKAVYMKTYDARYKRPEKIRPFVAIDSEGVSKDEFITIGNDRAQIQRTIFWGAATSNGVPSWFDGEPYCTSEQILDWLISLPKHFGKNAIFVWFGSSYDATQIFAELPYEKAWEIQNGRAWSTRDEEDPPPSNSNRYTFWKDFGISYLKQKCLKIVLLHDPDNPYNEKGKLRISASIVIYDVFGFFQSSFLKAANSIPGAMTSDEKKLIEEGKKSRATFELEEREKWQRYTEAELHVLARMMERLREGVEALGLKLTRWQGAGSIAAAMMKKMNSKQHFHPVYAHAISLEQDWAHRAFFGGRIECLKQGRSDEKLLSYDIRSAYPFHMSRLPSMHGGEFRLVENPTRAQIESANILSMFEIDFECNVSDDPILLNRYHMQAGPEFYPLPYRDNRGSITYPPCVRGTYMADEVRAVFDWMEYYERAFATQPRYKINFSPRFEIKRALIFIPAENAPEAFPWIGKYYEQRKEIVAKNEATGAYDILEKVIKLFLNSLYGKTAQSIGTRGKPPATACPWYAAAITAGTRAQILRAALSAKRGSIIAFQTDGIVTKRALDVREGRALGQWEKEKVVGTSIFVQPGVYHIAKAKPASKHRGIKADLLGIEENQFGEWLGKNVADLWETGEESIAYKYRYYVTLGAAIASRERWQACGSWVDSIRELQLNNLGFKRAPPIWAQDKQKRSHKLIDTIPKPAFFHTGYEGEFPLSAPHKPDWLDVGLKAEYELENLNEEIFMCREG